MQRRRGGRPPGPSYVEMAVMCAARRRVDPFDLLPELTRRYGAIVDVPVPVPSRTFTLLSHPDHAQHVLTRHYVRYPRDHFADGLLTGEERDVLPILEGQSWRQWRRSLSPHFTESMLARTSASAAAALWARTAEWVAHTEFGEWIDLEHEIGVVVLDALMRSMFGTQMNATTLDRMVDATRDLSISGVTRQMTSMLPGFLPRPHQRRGEVSQGVLLRELDEIICAHATRGPGRESDVLDTLATMSAEVPAEQRHRRVRAELSSLVFAGYETTTQSVAWTIALLHRNPMALARARADVDGPGDEIIGYEHVQRMPYLRAAFDEALRLAAPLVMVRTAAEDDEIGGYVIPKASDVLISPYIMHRNPEFWPEPEAYRPDRFLDGQENPKAFIPFGSGPHKCLGWRLAYVEGLMTLAAILRRYTVDIQPGWAPRPTSRITTALVGGLPVRLRRR